MTVETINPATGKVEYTLELVAAAAVESSLAASASAFPAWSARPLEERGDFLRKAGARGVQTDGRPSKKQRRQIHQFRDSQES